MALKIDLEMACDRVRWDFIEGTLSEAGFPDELVQLVMFYVSLISLHHFPLYGETFL